MQGVLVSVGGVLIGALVRGHEHKALILLGAASIRVKLELDDRKSQLDEMKEWEGDGGIIWPS